MPSTPSPIDEIRAQSPGFLLSRLSRLLRERNENCLKPLKLSLRDFIVLRLIGAASKLPQGEIGGSYGIDRATMVAVIDSLEARGLVLRERNIQDRRSYILRLTKVGTRILAHAKRLTAKEQKEFLQPLSALEWETVRDCLWRLFLANNSEQSNG